jgi:hypothetical protein
MNFPKTKAEILKHIEANKDDPSINPQFKTNTFYYSEIYKKIKTIFMHFIYDYIHLILL